MEINKAFEEYFASLNIKIRLFPDSKYKTFKSFKIFYNFINSEYEYWNQITQGDSVSSIKNHFSSIKNLVNNTYSYSNNYESNAYNAQQALQNTLNLLQLGVFPCIFSATEEAKLIISYYKSSPSQAEAVCDYLFNKRHRYYNDLEYFKGLINIHLAQSKIYMNEMAATSTMKSIEDTITKSHDELNNLHNEFYEKYEDISGKSKDFKEDVTSWKNDIQSKTESFLTEKEKKLNDLEKLYNEKLRLEGPAKYWKDIENEYKKNGTIWTCVSIGVSVLFVLAFYYILRNAPDTIFASTELNLNSLRGTIILTLIASVGVYLIRLFVKLAISSYHLSRDAKERYQLTHVYLSLMDNDAMKDSDRNVVLQSIFSRSDTGLLKGDSSPTLPDSISQLIKTLNK